MIKAWSLVGFTASPLSADRHEELIRSLRLKAGTRETKNDPLACALANIGNASDVVALVGWNVEIDPGILLSGKALDQTEAFWRDTYPDGFLVCDQPLSQILIVDFNEVACVIEELRFSRD
jgi:hypothetical protein